MDKPCPKCGHCPTCGRSNAPYQVWPPYWPYYQQPYTYPYQWHFTTSPNISYSGGSMSAADTTTLTSKPFTSMLSTAASA